MEKLTTPPDAEQTQLTEVSNIGGEPAPPPLPSSVRSSISPTSVLTGGAPAKVADRPTTTDPVPATSRSRKASTKAPQRSKSRRDRKSVRAKTSGVRKWKGLPEDCASTDLIDAVAARLKGGGTGLSQRSLNIGVVAFVVVLILAANWATRRPASTPEQTNIVEISEPVTEPTAPAEAQPAPVQQKATAQAEAASDATSPAPAQVPATAQVETPTAAEAAATSAPDTQPIAETASAQDTVAAKTPEEAAAVAEPSQAAAAQVAQPSAPHETPTKEDGDADGNDSGVEVVMKANAPKAKVAAKAARKTTPVKASAASKGKPEKLPAIIAGEPYTAGGPQDLDSDATRQRYLQETKLSAKRGAPAGKTANNPTGKQNNTGRQPTPPKQGTEKTLDELENSYEQPLPASK